MPSADFPKLSLLGVDFHNIRMSQALALITDAIKAGTQKQVFFINADCLNKAVSDKTYCQILNRADYVLPDGAGVKLGCQIMGKTVVENVNGTDMLPLLCGLAVQQHFSLYLLGAKPGVALKTKQALEAQYPGLHIAGEQHGYFTPAETPRIIGAINASPADVLLVAFGSPAQEKWIQAHASTLLPSVLIGVGGLFDFYSGNMPRAPQWLRKRGLEWTYRLYQEPQRMFKRYIIGNPLFVYRVYYWKWFKQRQVDI